MKLNNKGFTLLEVLAVVVILGVISTIMITSVGSVLRQSKEDNYKNLEKSIKSAARVCISDHRYDISLDTASCDAKNQRNIKAIKINNVDTTINSHISLKLLIDNEYLSTNKDNKILDPRDNREIDKETSYITVKYNCKKRDYDYEDIAIYYK